MHADTSTHTHTHKDPARLDLIKYGTTNLAAVKFLQLKPSTNFQFYVPHTREERRKKKGEAQQSKEGGRCP